MTRVKLAVIGVGALGQHHARILSGMSDVELVGVVDARESQGRMVAEKHGTRWFAAAADVQPLVDGVIVAVPTVLHGDVAKPFLESGQAVLIEKPLAHDLDTALRLHRLSQFRRALLQVGHVERFNPAFELLQQQVGRPLYIRCQRFSPYSFRSVDIGVVHDLMIHDIDLVLSLTGSEVVSVDSFGAVAIGPHEDMATARLRMSCGAVVDLTASRLNPTAERTVQVWSDRGFAGADLTTRQVTSWAPCAALAAAPTMVHDVIAATPNPLTLKDEVFTKWITREVQQAPADDALTAELRDFVGSIREGRRPRVSGADAVAAMEVADRVLSGLSCWSWQSGAVQPRAERVA
ncbi:MAG: Gfo/Idh/MocA family oxidoreductase [Planctomyces sp.]|jgi:predicted dehydrogenase|nr:Gfo/Idh/MocA family oxidoreductase [Planctomyces sp.]GDX92514.1 NADH-dependent dehydrogenase [Planctomycetia bacterium]HAV33170.1 gfo/Idh/MocA family oxidoreductase [Planctomycetaceae bacterium]HBC61007.1 gfo/Idh/MocA family oxidoreductase [Planctomycetaceae bacterium]